MIAVTVFLALVLLRWGLLFVGALFLVARVRDCPACFEPTLKLRRPWLRRLASWLEWRWCPTCSWQGLSRRKEGGLARTAARPPEPDALFRGG
ncbi:MAG: hypothetical protein R3223_10445 [Longimicrobiales bacterium]|nr:hypothetical protein [Longimicrobiales bacterium]